jgi:hypothetical protein
VCVLSPENVVFIWAINLSQSMQRQHTVGGTWQKASCRTWIEYLTCSRSWVGTWGSLYVVGERKDILLALQVRSNYLEWAAGGISSSLPDSIFFSV